MVREAHVARRRLISDLAAVDDNVPLILVIAAAGYGKTVALQQWAATDPRPFAWVTLDPSDADPGRLLRRAARALHVIQPFDDATWRALSLPSDEIAAVAIPRLMAAVHRTPWVLVIDDLHVIRGSPAHRTILELAERAPTGCHVAVAARTRLGLFVGKLRSEGRCAEFGPDDLRLSAAEARTLMNATGARLPPAQVFTLTRRFEGWPAGLFLAALSLRGQVDPASAAAQITGADGYLAEYFRDVVLAGEPASTVRFLLRISPLEVVSGDLCDAVLRRRGSGRLLTDLAGRNVFLERNDSAGHSYRFHPVFREMLLAELRRSDAASEQAVHLRAAAWFERHKSAVPALRHAAAAGDALTTARLVLRHGRLLIDEGLAGLLAATLDTLGGAAEHDALLAAHAGWIYAFAGRTGQPAACLDAAVGGKPDSAVASAAIDRLRTALAPGGVDGMLGSARRAARVERPGSDWYAVTMTLLGVAEELTGNTVLAMTRFARAALTGAEHRTAAAFALAGLGWHAVDRGETETAAAYAEESAALIEGSIRPYGWSVLTHLLGARVALDAGNRSRFADLVGAARPALAQAQPFPWLAATASIRLSRLALDAGDSAAAHKAAAGARLALTQLSSAGVLTARYRSLVTDLGSGWTPDDTGDVAGLTTAEQRVLRLLPTHLTLNRIAGDLRLSRNTVKTQVAAIYRKLDASDRATAVQRGRELGLLG